MKTALLAIVFVFTTFILFAQPSAKADKDKDRIVRVCDSIVQAFSGNHIPEAMALLKQNSVMESSAIDSLEAKINRQMETIILPRYGKMLSFEFIKEKKIKNVIAKRYYMIKLDKYFLKVDFVLYNNGSNWTITTYNLNENIDELLTD
ncbi:MAG: hypothetical protein M3R72_03335 [Bacteroidota bacterium]|nr:hypothetical protein [Bacteroidota bacterium]